MIVEIVNLEAKDGQSEAMRDGLRKARDVIAQSPGSLGSAFHQSIERPERFVLYIKWMTVENHTEGFRKGPLFSSRRSHWAEFIAGPPDVLHFEVFSGDV